MTLVMSSSRGVSMSEIPVFKFAIKPLTSGISSTLTEIDFLPKRGTDKATGWDVRAAESIKLRAGQYAKIPLGFRVLAPDGWWLELRPRSSTFAKKYLHCLYGVIDEDYEGQCLFACQYMPDISSLGNDLIIEFGDAIGQIIPVKRQEMTVQLISEKEYEQEIQKRAFKRGAGGFGSTG
jgi:dUTP pyrophosphatase